MTQDITTKLTKDDIKEFTSEYNNTPYIQISKYGVSTKQLKQQVITAFEVNNRLDDKNLINFSVGKIVQLTKGKINPEIIQKILIIYQQYLKGMETQ